MLAVTVMRNGSDALVSVWLHQPARRGEETSRCLLRRTYAVGHAPATAAAVLGDVLADLSAELLRDGTARDRALLNLSEGQWRTWAGEIDAQP